MKVINKVTNKQASNDCHHHIVAGIFGAHDHLGNNHSKDGQEKEIPQGKQLPSRAEFSDKHADTTSQPKDHKPR